MPSPASIMQAASAFLNDQAQSIFTNANQLAYLNQAMRDLQEQYELNDVPITHETSQVINIDAGTAGTVKIIGYSTTPALPSNLIEIKRLWESPEGQSLWVPMDRVSYLPQYQFTAQIPQFLIWTWESDEIRLISASQDNDIKIDYIKSMFTPILAANVGVELGIKFDKCFSFLAYRTAAMSALYIGENEDRANELNQSAGTALWTALGISAKGRQSITTRRLPFRFGFKNNRASFGGR